MDDEIRTLKAFCKIYPSIKVREFQYQVMDNLGLKRKKPKNTDKDKLVYEYLWRKYGLGGRAAQNVNRFLGKRFKEKDLKKVLGRE